MVSPKLLAQRVRKSLERRGIVVDAIYLFGSHSRGAVTPDSDIDLLVVSPTFAQVDFWTRCARAGEAISEIHEPVQVYPVSPAEFRRPESGGFLESIRSEQKLIFRRHTRRLRKALAARPVMAS